VSYFSKCVTFFKLNSKNIISIWHFTFTMSGPWKCFQDIIDLMDVTLQWHVVHPLHWNTNVLSDIYSLYPSTYDGFQPNPSGVQKPRLENTGELGHHTVATKGDPCLGRWHLYLPVKFDSLWKACRENSSCCTTLLVLPSQLWCVCVCVFCVSEEHVRMWLIKWSRKYKWLKKQGQVQSRRPEWIWQQEIA
jgi:hypothetical protein